MDLAILHQILFSVNEADTSSLKQKLTAEQQKSKEQKNLENKINILGLGKDLNSSAFKSKKKDLEDYLKVYSSDVKLGQLIFGSEFKLVSDKDRVSLDQETERNFETANKKYGGYFSKEDFETYKAAYKVCHYNAHVLGDGLPGVNGQEIGDRAYKMMVICGSDANNLKNATVLINKLKAESTAPIHDVFNNLIPIYDEKAKPYYQAWRELIANDDSHLAISSFVRANEIANVTPGYVPENLSALKDVLTKLKYSRNEENQSLAKLYSYYNIDAETFNRTLDFQKDGIITPKDQDNIPNVVIDIGKLDDNSQGYYLVKLPKNDPRGLVLGKITDCCQSIGGSSEKCVIDGMTLENNGFYVFVKTFGKKSIDFSQFSWSLEDLENKGHKIIGQSYVWRSNDGSLTCDSVEMLNGHRGGTPSVKDALVEMAKQMAKQDPSLERVTIGLGGGTASLSNLTLKRAESSAEMFQGFFYGDSSSQSEIWILPKEERGIQRTKLLEQLKEKKILNDDAVNYLLNNIQNAFFKDLTSLGAIKTYEAGIKFEQLKDLELEKIRALTSGEAIKVYKAGITFDQLKDLNVEKIKALTSGDAKVYEAGITFDQLKDLNVEKIKALTSRDARDAYEAGITFDQLKDLKVEQIKALTSRDAIEAYEAGITFDQLKDLNVEKIKALTSENAIEAYKAQSITFDQIKDLELEKIKALTSEDAIKAYKAGITFDQLKDLKVEQIEDLIKDPKQINTDAWKNTLESYRIEVSESKRLEAINKEAVEAVKAISDQLSTNTSNTPLPQSLRRSPSR